MTSRYLDWAASAPPYADILDEATAIAKRYYGNPSSPHTPGRSARDLLDSSRKRFAAAAGIDPTALIFTSGATEANNMVLASMLLRERHGHLVVSAIEHSSVHEPALFLQGQGTRVTWLPAGTTGSVDPGRLEEALEPETSMVAVMQVNNETGAIQPIEEIARVVRTHERAHGRPIHLHCDAVQGFGKVPAAYTAVDSASFSAHKFGGPRGVGALYLKRPLPLLYRGGGQEGDRRPGTENLPAIWAMAEAAARSAHDLDEHTAQATGQMERLIEGISAIDGAHLIPEDRASAPYSPFILSAAFPPLPGEVLVRVLSDRGYAISMGSACSSRHHKERRVLTNMGVRPELALSAIRISIGYASSDDELLGFVASLEEEVSKWNIPLKR